MAVYIPQFSLSLLSFILIFPLFTSYCKGLLLGRKVMTKLDSIFKSRDITLPTKVCLVYGFSCGHVWMWELDCEESWALKNWCFWTVVLKKTLENLLDSKDFSLEYSLEGLMMKLKLHYFGHLMWRAGLLEKTLMLANIEGRRRRTTGMRWLYGITDSMGMNLQNLQDMVMDREA